MALYKMMKSGVIDTLTFLSPVAKKLTCSTAQTSLDNRGRENLPHLKCRVQEPIQYIEGDLGSPACAENIVIWSGLVRKEYRNLNRLLLGLNVPFPRGVTKTSSSWIMLKCDVAIPKPERWSRTLHPFTMTFSAFWPYLGRKQPRSRGFFTLQHFWHDGRAVSPMWAKPL